MAQVQISETGALGDALDTPATVDLAMVGVMGAPVAAEPARVQVAAVMVAAYPWSELPAQVQLAQLIVAGAPWAPAPDPDDTATLWRIDPDGVWRPDQLVLIEDYEPPVVLAGALGSSPLGSSPLGGA